MGTQIFEILCEYSMIEGGLSWEARGPAGARVTIWPGNLTANPSNVHPLIPAVIGSGIMNGEAVWIELRPGALVLEDCIEHASTSDRFQWAAQICDAISAVHAKGQVHGAVHAQSVVIDAAATPFLIGTGRVEGSPEEDLQATLELAKRLIPTVDLPDQFDSAAALGARLREYASELEERTPIQLNTPKDPTPIRSVSIEVVFSGPMDEVKLDIGADDIGRGLLDRWSQTDDEDGFTEDPTESVDRSTLHTSNHPSIQASVDQHLIEIIAKLDNKGISPNAEFRTLILSEMPDPLCLPEGLPHGKLHNPEGDAERTAEVPHALPFPEVTAGDETTGITNTASIQASLMTGLWTAVVVGMLGAVIMLILVWAVIGGVF